MTETGLPTPPARRGLVLRSIFAALAAYALILPGTLPARAATKAGVSAAVRGTVERTLENITSRIRSGQDIFMGDGIRSHAQSGMQLMLLDETVFTIGPDSELIIDEFVYDPQTGSGHVATTLTKGALRFVTGKIAKGDPEDVTITLPVGSVGIRGTFGIATWDGSRALVLLLGPGADNDAFSEEGRLDVTANGQTIKLTRPGYGTSIVPGQPPAPAFRFTPELVNMVLGGGPGTPTKDDASTEETADTSEGTASTDETTTTSAGETDTADSGTEGDGSSTQDGGTATDVETAAGGDTTLALEATETTTTLAASDTSSAEVQTQITTQQVTADITTNTDFISPIGLTTLFTLAGFSTGSLVFSDFGVPLESGALGFENGTFDTRLEVDLAAQTIGGGTSSIMVSGPTAGGPASTVTYPIPSIPLSWGYRDFALYVLNLNQSAGTNTCVYGCTATLTVQLIDIRTVTPGAADIFLYMADSVSAFIGEGDTVLPETGIAGVVQEFDATELTDLAGITSGVFHYQGVSNFTQTRMDGGSVHFDGTMKASLEIDFGARTFGGGLSGIIVDTTAAGGNISAETGIGAGAFPVAPSNAPMDFTSLPLTNTNFILQDGQLRNKGTAIAARAALTIAYDVANGTDYARGAMLTGLRAAGPAPAP